MINHRKMHKITFSITPNPNGYIIGCNEIPSLFTEVTSIVDVDMIVRSLLSDYIDNFPDLAHKRGFDRNIPIEMIWCASPNSIALE